MAILRNYDYLGNALQNYLLLSLSILHYKNVHMLTVTFLLRTCGGRPDVPVCGGPRFGGNYLSYTRMWLQM